MDRGERLLGPPTLQRTVGGGKKSKKSVIPRATVPASAQALQVPAELGLDGHS